MTVRIRSNSAGQSIIDNHLGTTRSTELHTMISDVVDYGKTKQTFQELQNRLELNRG